MEQERYISMDKKRKTRKLSLVTKLMLFIGVVVWLSVCLVVAIITTTRRNDMVEMAGEQSIAVSKLLSSYIDVTSVMEAQNNTETYDFVKEQLNKASKDANMEYVYTLWTDGNKVYYGVDGSMENSASYGDEFEESYTYLKDAFLGGAVVDTELVKSEDGNYYITAYVPLLSGDGEVVSVLACDFNANGVFEKILKAWRWLFVYATGGMLVAGISLFAVIRKTIKNVAILNDKVDELIYSNGDLTKQIDVKSGDEIENLANSINALMKYIRDVVVNISSGSKQVNSASVLMAKDLEQAQGAITDVSAIMEEMSAGMEETSASLLEITQNISSIYEKITSISNRASESARYCCEVMNKASEINSSCEVMQESALKETSRIAEEIGGKIENSKRVEEIHGLVDAILQISSQTNLLSLNASIESARAGESGKGFAVVAGEIGKLANECKESASRISEVSDYVIGAVNELAGESQRMVNFSSQEISQSCKALKEASESYKNDVNEIWLLMQEFESACEELKDVMDSIKESVNMTNIAVEESAKGVSTTAEAVVTLSSSTESIMQRANENTVVSSSLDSEVNKFKF